MDPVHLLWVKNRTGSGDRCQDPALDEYPHLSWPGRLHAESEAKGSYLAGWRRGPDNRVQNSAWHPRAVPCRSALSPGGWGEEHGVLPAASQEQESLSLRTVSPLLGTVSLPEAHPGVLPRCLSPRLAPGPAPGRPPSQLGVPGPAPPLTRAALTTGNWHCVGLLGPCVEPMACLCLLPPLARGPEDARSARAASRFRLEGLVCPPAAFRPRGCVRLGWPSVQMAFRSRQEGGG